jgi:hypothetical protein
MGFLHSRRDRKRMDKMMDNIMAGVNAGQLRMLPQQRYILREMQHDLIEWKHNGQLVRGRATGELYGAEAVPMLVGYARFILEPSGAEVWEFPTKVLAEDARLVDSGRPLPSPLEVLLQDPNIEPQAKAELLKAMSSSLSSSQADVDGHAEADDATRPLAEVAPELWGHVQQSWATIASALSQSGPDFRNVTPLPPLAQECVDVVLNQTVTPVAAAAFAVSYWACRAALGPNQDDDAIGTVEAQELNDWVANVDMAAFCQDVPVEVWEALPALTNKAERATLRVTIALGILTAIGESACSERLRLAAEDRDISLTVAADQRPASAGTDDATDPDSATLYFVEANATADNEPAPLMSGATVAQASQFCGICGARLDAQTCLWCGSSLPAELTPEALAHEVLKSARDLIEKIVPDEAAFGPFEDEWWEIAIGPRVGIIPTEQACDGVFSPLCIEITTSEPDSADLALLMEMGERFASLAACYPHSTTARYSRVALRPCDDTATLARLVANAWLVQAIESQGARTVLANNDSPYGPLPTIADLAHACDRPAFSFSADIENAQQRRDSLTYVRTRRQGEVYLMNVVRAFDGRMMPVACSAGLQEHPVWGDGLLVTGSHNADWSAHDREDVRDYVRTLANEDRTRSLTSSCTDLLGSWCIDTDNRPAFVTFVPEALCESGSLNRVLDQLLGRFDWMARYTLQEMENQGQWLTG